MRGFVVEWLCLAYRRDQSKHVEWEPRVEWWLRQVQVPVLSLFSTLHRLCSRLYRGWTTIQTWIKEEVMITNHYVSLFTRSRMQQQWYDVFWCISDTNWLFISFKHRLYWLTAIHESFYCIFGSSHLFHCLALFCIISWIYNGIIILSS